MKKSRGTSGPLVSIVTVTLNAGAALERTIESVRWQSYPLIQYVVVDGGSTDGTLDMIKKFKNTIDRVVSEEDSGIYHAMN
jgi:glycosyltransferase involved in cell wall biosynthesis